MVKKKTKAKKAPKRGKAKKRAAPKNSKQKKGKRKDKFSMTWDEMKESKEWKSDWDDDAGDFEGDSGEY
ncbi:MAG: hypothetical protein QXR53_01780 [Candidatus Norongarragalinales archaeon]